MECTDFGGVAHHGFLVSARTRGPIITANLRQLQELLTCLWTGERLASLVRDSCIKTKKTMITRDSGTSQSCLEVAWLIAF